MTIQECAIPAQRARWQVLRTFGERRWWADHEGDLAVTEGDLDALPDQGGPSEVWLLDSSSGRGVLVSLSTDCDCGPDYDVLRIRVPLRRRDGRHGCVYVPAKELAWLRTVQRQLRVYIDGNSEGLLAIADSTKR